MNEKSKIKTFISYASPDKRKQEIAHDVFKEKGIDPIVVDRREEPFEDFSNKIERSMEEADVLVPLLTRQSICNQWVNQEIGYGRRLFTEKKIDIIPIVEDTILEKLNGFIHKHREAYIFNSKENDLRTENKNFKVACIKVAKHISNKKIKNYGKFALNLYFSNLSVRGFTDSDALQLNASLTIENNGSTPISIRTIEIPYSSLIENFGDLSYPSVTEVVFLSDYINDGHSTISLRNSPINVKATDILSIPKLIFTANKPFYEDHKFDIRNKLTNYLRTIKNVDIKINSLSGEWIEKEVLVNQ